MPLASRPAADAIRPASPGKTLSLPAQIDQPLGNQGIDRGVDRRHRFSPVVLACQSPSDLAWTDRRAGPSRAEKLQSGVPRVHGSRGFPRRRARPVVRRSGLAGGFHPAGGALRPWLVPSPMAPGIWRSNPETSAWAASSAVAPPRMRLILSRHLFASSKSSARAAASILLRKSSIVSLMTTQRAAPRLSGARFQFEAPRRGFTPPRLLAAYNVAAARAAWL